MARTDPQTNIRLPADLKDRLEAAAAASGRSVTAEIVHRLDRSFGDIAEELGIAGLRAQIAGERELARSTFEMLSRYVDELESPSKRAALSLFPGQDAGKTAEQSLAETLQAREVFREIVEGATLLLSELAIAEARNDNVDVAAFRQRAKALGVL